MRLTSFDVETRGTDVGYGLQPARLREGNAWITMCAMVPADGEPQQFVRPSVDELRRWLVDCSQKKTTIVCWNAAFDIAWLLAMGLRDEVYACNWLDGMLLWKYISNSPDWLPHAVVRYGLKQAVETFLPHFAGYDEGIDFDTDDPEEFKKLMSYNVKDALYTTMLAQHFWEQMSPEQRRCATIEARCLPMVAEANLNGICMDMNAASMLVYKLEGAANEALEELHRTDPNVTPDVLASPAKLRKLLFEDWGLTSVKETDKGAFSTDRDALSLLADVDPRAALLNSYRENKNNATKFAYGTLEALQYNGDGKARPTARVFSTYTGRMTYSSAILRGKDKRKTGVPLHQWKRDPEFRRLILAPEGQTLMEFDFSGQEFRWMAVMSNDATMLNLCAPGEDAHAFMGATIGGGDYRAFQKLLELKDPATKNLRQLGKVGNLSCAYRTSWATLQRVARVQFHMLLADYEARKVHASYRKAYPGAVRYWAKQIEHVTQYGYVDTIAGRRINLLKGEDWEGKWKWGIESTSINGPIQGSGADQKYLAMAVLRDYLPTVDGRFYYELHDGLFVVIPDAYAERAVHEIKHLLSNLPYKSAWGVDLPIQFPVDAKMGKSWGDLKEVL